MTPSLWDSVISLYETHIWSTTFIMPELSSDFLVRLTLTSLVVLVGLLLGLFLRHKLVKRLKKTVLDNWLVQTLGVVSVLPTTVLATVGSATITTQGMTSLQAIEKVLKIQSEDIYQFGGRVLGSLLILALAIGAGRTLSRLMVRGLNNNRLNINLRTVIGRICYILVMIIAIFWMLSLWQVAIELPVAVLGTLTIAVTFSIQEILKNLVAGLYILMERPFVIGDHITMDKYSGQVVGVELRATRLRMVSGEEITIPNGMIFSGVVVNTSRYNERRATVTLTLPLKDFVRHQTPEQIITCLRDVEEVPEKPEPSVAVSGITGEKIELTLRFWIVTGQLATVTDVVYALRTLLPTADLAVTETAGDL